VTAVTSIALPNPSAVYEHWRVAWPKIRRGIHTVLRHFRRSPDYEDMVQEAAAQAWLSVVSLDRRGVDWCQWPGRIGKHAAYHARAGRKIVRAGKRRPNGAAARPRSSRTCPNGRRRFPPVQPCATVESLLPPALTADIAPVCALRCDFLQWFGGLTQRQRCLVAGLLRFGAVAPAARASGMSNRVASALRRALLADWQAYQATADA
jgi:DNA-directed RNA polymerase specialized sigma24 family protein